MGWKAFKEHFGIKHQVQLDGSSETLFIGSAYVHDIVAINTETGKFKESSALDGFIERNYPSLKEASAEEIINLISKEDSFERSLPVFTAVNGEVLEMQCEEYGYPNITHCGRMMYENTFFKTREEAHEYAVKEVGKWIEFYKDQIERTEKELDKLKARSDREYIKLLKLEGKL